MLCGAGGQRVQEMARIPGSRNGVHVMLYPQLCRLVLELLINHPLLPPPDGVLAHVLMKLISLSKQSVYIATMLYNQVYTYCKFNHIDFLIENIHQLISLFMLAGSR